MDAIFVAVFSVTTIGIVCAAVLCVASHFMYIKVDEHLIQLQEYLPGANCGACGYPGCSGYAAALLADHSLRTNLCTPGGAAVAAKISAYLGVETETVTRKFAVVHCLGFRRNPDDERAQQKKMEYKGIQTCKAAKQLFGGEGACAFGCLGYGDCQRVCPSHAICISYGLARIHTKLCTGCGLCVNECPNKLISVSAQNAQAAVSVLCSNIEKGAVTRKKCLSGCIACGKCVRECPAAAITIEDNLAKIDYKKCEPYGVQQGCRQCVDVCVTKCIQTIHLPETGTQV